MFFGHPLPTHHASLTKCHAGVVIQEICQTSRDVHRALEGEIFELLGIQTIKGVWHARFNRGVGLRVVGDGRDLFGEELEGNGEVGFILGIRIIPI